jgi:hypothetical protein
MQIRYMRDLSMRDRHWCQKKKVSAAIDKGLKIEQIF